MRILMYTDTAFPKMGGQEMVVDALARQFVDAGHDLVVLAPRPRLPLRPADGSLPYRVVRHPRFYSTHHFVGWYRWFLLRLRASFPFDVMHCHGVYPAGYVASLCASRWSAPSLLTSHGGDVQENCRRLEKPGLLARRTASVQSADALIAISSYTRAGFLRLGADPARIVDLPNGVPFAELSRPADRPPGLDPGIMSGDYFLFLGRLRHRKGVDVLLDALARQPARGGVELVVAGDGEDRASFEQQAARLGLLPRVRFVGVVKGEAKAYLLQNARCLVVPSRLSEGFPLVVFEAFAGRVPVLASRLVGMEMIEPGRTGWLVTPESPVELAEAMQRVWSLGEGSRILGEAGYRFAERHDWRSVAARHLELYERVIARRSAGLAA